jgi:hypothetical protein
VGQVGADLFSWVGWVRLVPFFGFSNRLNLVFCLITGLKWFEPTPSIFCFVMRDKLNIVTFLVILPHS